MSFVAGSNPAPSQHWLNTSERARKGQHRGCPVWRSLDARTSVPAAAGVRSGVVGEVMPLAVAGVEERSNEVVEVRHGTRDRNITPPAIGRTVSPRQRQGHLLLQ